MKFAYFICVFILGLCRFQATGRAVNISSVWVLPQEGFPVFYRYFNEKVTWNEAEAVCGFHHADLLSVQTSDQMDSARAYMKEIDVADNIWIGLHKESPEKPFTWTDGEKVLGEGYWLEPVAKTNEKLCAAIDPISDFRWRSFYCRGPQVASFVCELPVPEWAKKEDGCMVTSLPSLTVTFIPEMGIVQLFSDCGLDGTRRIACKGGINRNEIIRRLSCDEDAFVTKQTTDSTNASNPTQRPNDTIKKVKGELTTQSLKSRGTHFPQTRHKREMATNSQRETNSDLELSSTPVTSTQTGNVLKVPSHVFPHSPHSPIERNRLTTKTPESKAENSTSIRLDEMGTAKMADETVSSAFNESAMAVIPPKLFSNRETENEETTTKLFVEDPHQIPPNLKKGNVTERPAISSTSDDALPVLIITGQSLSDSIASNSTTSENPQIVFVIDEKEEFADEPYSVPINHDVIINNPSFSPMELIDVDLMELDNLTTIKSLKIESTRTSTIAEASSKRPPLTYSSKIGEKIINDKNEATAIFHDSTVTPTASTNSIERNATASNNLTTRMEENVMSMGEPSEIAQRPNRGRLLTHSNHPSFYPYFLNRVLG